MIQRDEPRADRLAYNIEEVSLKLDLPVRKVEMEIATGRLKSFKSGRSRRVSHDALLDYISERELEDQEVRNCG